MFATVSFVLALSAIGLAWGLGSHAPVSAHSSLIDIVSEGLAAARNPRIALAYLAGFASRGDAVAITSFLALWVSSDARAHGLNPDDALARAGMISGIAQTLAIIGAPFVGILSDRIDRALCLTLSATWAMLAYALLFSLNAPTGVLIYVASVAVGLGEIFMIVSAQVLIASEAPTRVRGSVGGCFGLLGSASILATSFAGGFLYDSWRPSAPFGLIAFCNALVVLVGIAVVVDTSRRGRVLWHPERPSSTDDLKPSTPKVEEEQQGLLVQNPV
jgi:MFS family permease